ncbi:MAG: ATP-binding protein [Bacteroidia bacterium]
MTLKVKYWLYVLCLHAVILLLAFRLLEDQKGWIMAVEAGIILSLLISFWLYRNFVLPVKLISQGVDAIRSNDFQQNLAPAVSPDVTSLIEAYNAVMAKIREERKEIQTQHYFLEKLIDASPSGILILDYDGKLTYLNPAAGKLLGLTAASIGRPLREMGHAVLSQVWDLEGGQSKVISLNGISQYKCQMAHFLHRGFARKFLMIEELTRELLESEKRAYGKVIRMMAHEVNNSIGPINSILHSVIDMQNEKEDGDENMISALQVAIERNENLNQFMKNFAQVVRLPEVKPEECDLETLIGKVTALLQAEASAKGIVILTDIAGQPLRVSLDSNLMEQALLNIVRNSIESIGQNGQIFISTRLQPLRLTIADNGPGLSEKDAQQLFTPFFSTKPRGQGIGLTLVREILTRHGISFSLKTDPDGWTRFEMVWER